MNRYPPNRYGGEGGNYGNSMKSKRSPGDHPWELPTPTAARKMSPQTLRDYGRGGRFPSWTSHLQRRLSQAAAEKDSQ